MCGAARRLQAERAQQQAQGNNAHVSRQDNMRNVFAHPDAPTPQAQRLRPEELPPAGAKGPGAAAKQQSSPFALHYTAPGGQHTTAQLAQSGVWKATYSPPQYGRKRCARRRARETRRRQMLAARTLCPPALRVLLPSRAGAPT